MTIPSPPAGWYADPWRVANWRWWDGSQWSGYTDHQPLVATTATGAYVPVPTVEDQSRPIRAGWIALLGAVGGVVGSLVVYFVLERLIGVDRTSPWLTLAVQLGLWIPLVTACVVAVRTHGSGSLRDLGFTVRWIDLALGLGFGVAALIGVGNIARALKSIGIEPHRESLMEPLRRSTLTTIVIVFIAVIGAPIVEELFFRGLLMSGLVSRWGAAIGVIVQAGLFGLVHLGPTDARGNLGVFLLIAPLGAMLGILRYSFKRLGPGIVTHALYNAAIVTFVLSR